MSITDELRKWGYGFCGSSYEVVNAIADRIDAEHEKGVVDALLNDGLPMSDKLMAEHGWVRLPVDADGEYIHVGERVQLIGNDPSTVSHMSLADDGWRVYVKYDGRIGTGSGEPKRIRHYHAPTVEDVLTELTDEVWNRYCVGGIASDSGISELVAEYAAKLRLAGDAE